MSATLAATLAIATCHGEIARGQGREEETVRESIEALNEIMAIPAQAIPQRMLAGAEGIAVIPNVIKGGLVIGARHGRGTLMVRDENRNWHAPLFVTITGGSVGWQAGVQSTDVILVFKTKKSIQGILSKKFTLGVDATAAAGPVGRQAAAATDIQLQAEIFSYARSRGLFLGASLDGSMLKVDGMANAAYYRSPAPGQPAVIPPSAIQLLQLVAAYSDNAVTPVEPSAEAAPTATLQQPMLRTPPAPSLAQQYATSEADVLREQLSTTSPELFEKLDPQWTAFLALPGEVFSSQSHPSLEALQQSLDHYETVMRNPQYQALTSLPAFQSTYDLLRHYQSALLQEESQLQLPPPPPLVR
ncbi:MAG: lipid-binding SYLF domain-containing protein [Planctomycetales bacterium]|nr:lipid-binding SYLF domain-containing protein [Planctomycetales bacterium]